MKTLSIIIPVFNEQATLREILRRVLAVYIPDWQTEIIVVDDCSTDESRNILKQYGDKIKIIYQDKNRGKGSAVARGLEEATGEFAIIQDADLEYDPKEIPSLISAIKNEDSVIYGSRNIIRRRRTGFIIPRIGVWFITKLINILYGTELTDVWTCYKLFPAKVSGMFDSGGFEAEILFTLKLLKAGYGIAEVPISHVPRDVGEGKKIRYRDGFNVIALILNDRFGKVFLATMAVAVILLVLFLAYINPAILPESDSPSYLEAMAVMEGESAPESFKANRIITTFGGLSLVIILSKILGSYELAWLVMNIVFYLLATGVFYRLILGIHRSVKVAAVSTLFLAGNYAFLIFGPNYFMDMGGWFFYILAAFWLYSYARSGNSKDLLWSAGAVGVGGLFKEYAFLGAFLVGFYLIYESWPSVLKFFRKVWLPAIMVAIPTLILHLAVYKVYGYTYFNWLGANQDYYVYSSRIIEYIKTLGSLLNILAVLSLAGLFFLWKEVRGTGDSRNVPDKNTSAFIVCYFLSALPVLFWPAITQRITFVFVPIAVILASFLFRRFEDRWYLFLPVLLVYVLATFFMDSHILNFVNLPF